MLNLARGFLARGREVDIVLCQAKGSLMGQEPTDATLFELTATPELASRLVVTLGDLRQSLAFLRPVLLAKKTAPEIGRLRAMQRYLKARRPSVVLSALTYANLVALWARQRSESPVPVVTSERVAIHTYCNANARKARWRYASELIRRTYPSAD
ncbi:MAG: glycosyltransferase, partial [Halioglobus sp.]|nr:glycosyltransferase [Halioglobus sp.]